MTFQYLLFLEPETFECTFSTMVFAHEIEKYNAR